MDIWPVMQEELIRYRDLSGSIELHLLHYEKRCTEIIQKISQLSFDESQLLIDELFSIQNALAICQYKYKFPINKKLRGYVYELDQQDDFIRKYWYEKFTNGMTWPTS